MSDEKSQQQTSTESTVAGAAKTGKAISNIAKGAAAGGAHGAAIEAGKSSAKWLIPLIAAVLLPLILVAMLPSIIFGSLLGDGTDTPNGISSDEVLVQNMTAINESISFILSEGLTDVLERIDSDFASSGCDGKEINNPFGADVVFNANAFVSQYLRPTQSSGNRAKPFARVLSSASEASWQFCKPSRCGISPPTMRSTWSCPVNKSAHISASSPIRIALMISSAPCFLASCSFV